MRCGAERQGFSMLQGEKVEDVVEGRLGAGQEGRQEERKSRTIGPHAWGKHACMKAWQPCGTHSKQRATHVCCGQPRGRYAAGRVSGFQLAWGHQRTGGCHMRALGHTLRVSLKLKGSTLPVSTRRMDSTCAARNGSDWCPTSTGPSSYFRLPPNSLDGGHNTYI